MKTTKKSRSNRNRQRRVVITSIISVLLLILLGAGVWALRYNSAASKKHNADKSKQAATTSTSSTAQSSYSGGSDKGSSHPASSSTSASLTDNNGAVASTPPSDTWTHSADGAVTVYSPASGSLLHSGDTLSGASTASKLGFRLMDNVSGVIAQGSLNVVNGKFSATINFTTPGTEGRIDVFQQSPTGIESSNVSIPVSLK